MSYFGDLQVLAECETSIGAGADELPSWVPDWSTTAPKMAWPITEASASGPFVCTPTILEQKQLEVLVVHVDIIQTVHQFEIEAASYSERIKSLKVNVERISAGRDLSQKYIGGGNILQAIAQTLLLGLLAESYKPENMNWPSLHDSVQALSKPIDADGSSFRTDDPTDFYRNANDN